MELTKCLTYYVSFAILSVVLLEIPSLRTSKNDSFTASRNSLIIVFIPIHEFPITLSETMIVMGSFHSLISNKSLIACGERVEDILIYFMEFSSPLSGLCKNSGLPSSTIKATPYSSF